jgi:uncharacterized membrane protein YesL
VRRLLGWHTRAGEVGLRLFQLHVLWVLGALAGGVVLGVFPATAAVYAVARRDAVDDEGAERDRLRVEFWRAWRAELRTANVLGWALTAAGLALLANHRLLAAGHVGGVAPFLAGLSWPAAAVLAAVASHVFALAAHFDEGAGALLRRSAVLVVARPGLTLAVLGIWAGTLALYYVVPGLVPVFGVVAPAYLSFSYLWGTGTLPRPAAAAGPRPTPVLSGGPARARTHAT